jgi:hypothetical protein
MWIVFICERGNEEWGSKRSNNFFISLVSTSVSVESVKNKLISIEYNSLGEPG